MEITIQPCTPDDFESLVTYVVEHNPLGHNHIGYFGVTPEDIRSTLKNLDVPVHQAFMLARQAGRLVGIHGIDFDPVIGRAWLYGPIVTAKQWGPTADTLYQSLRTLIPETINEHEMFVDVENVRCRNFAARHDFQQGNELAIYFAALTHIEHLPPAEGQTWDDGFTTALETLHNRLFPNSNYTVPYMVGRLNEYNRLLISTDGQTLTGYLFFTYDPESGEGYIDLLGVAESYQQQGIGRRLMLAGLAIIRQYPGFRQANLTVDRQNTPALRLYDSLGFIHERDMVSYRRILT